MTTAGQRESRFGDITKVRALGTRFYAMSGERNTVIVTANVSNVATVVGETAALGSDARDIASNGSSQLYILTDLGLQVATLADTPVLGTKHAFNPGAGRWVIYSGGYVFAPAPGGLRVIDPALGEVSQSTAYGVADITLARLTSDGLIYGVDQKRAKMHVWRIMGARAKYISSFAAHNCRDIVQVLIDETAHILFVQCKHRIVGFNIPSSGAVDDAITVTLRQDYGKLAEDYTDFVKIGTDKYWTGVNADSPLNAGSAFLGRTYADWDVTNQAMVAAFPDMAVFATSDVTPYVGENLIPVIPDIIPPPVPPVIPVVPPVLPPPVAPPAPVITSSLVTSLTEDTLLSYTITATGAGPIYYDLGARPSWVTSINHATGVVLGMPPDPGTFNVTITATNAGGTDTKTLVVTVGVAVAPFGAVSVNSQVLCMVQADNLLYIGGDFTTVTDASGTVTRNFAACIDLSTALFTSWNPNCGGRINTIFSDHPTAPTAIYTACQTANSTPMGGVTARVAKLHPITAVGDPAWVVTTAASQYVNCGLVIGSTVYLGGTFVTLQGATRYSAGAVAASNAALQSWHPNNGDTVDANDRIIQYPGSLLPGIATMQNVSGTILAAGGFYVRTQAVASDYLAVGWGYINPTTGVFAQVPSGTGEIAGTGGCNHALAGANNFYVSHNLDGLVGTYDTRWRSLPAWDIPPASAYATDKWAILASSTPSIYPTYPNGGFGEGPRLFVEDPLSTDFFILGAFTTAFGVSGVDRTARVSAAGARVPSFAPVWGGGSITIYGGIRRGNALIIGGQFSSTLNGASRNGLTAVNATTGANY